MKLNTNKAYTLVELLVVVVVLAVIATIGFISYSGATLDAKNTKVTSDIVNLTSKITIMNSSGKSLKDFYLSGSSTNKAANVKVESNSNPNMYEVGKINFGELKEAKQDYIDTNNNNYIYAYSYSTQRQYYELAGQIHDPNGGLTAHIKGNYNPVIEGIDSPSLIAEKTDNTRFLVDGADATNMY